MPNVAVWVAASLVLGVLLAREWPSLAEGAGWLLPGAWCVGLAACWSGSRRAAYAGLAACCVACAAAGILLSNDATERAARPSVRAALDEEFGGFLLGSRDVPRSLAPTRARLVLVEDAARREDVVTLRVRVTSVEIRNAWRAVEGGAAITVAGTVREADRRRWHAGTELQAAVTFRRPPTYLNDGVPDAELGRALRGVSVVGSVKSGLLMEVRDRGSGLARASARARQAIRDAVYRTVGAEGQTPAIVIAVLIGDESGLSPELRDRWQAAGTYHVLAISGGNIAVVVALIVVLSSAGGAGPRTGAVLALGALAAFAWVVTPGSSVQRASLMAAIHLGARVLDHRATSWQALAAALAAMITVDPLSLHDVGLLLTCGATVALIECARHLDHGGARRPSRWLIAAVAATVSVELVVFPIQVWWFSRLSFAGLALNLVAVPLMTAAQVAGLLAVALDLVGGPGAAAGWFATQAVTTLDECVRLVEWVPWTGRMTPRPPAWLVVVYYAALVAWWGSRAPRRWLFAVPLAASGLAIAVGQPMPTTHQPPTGLRLTMLDVGQGESLLVESGGWRSLIDAAGRPFGDGLDVGRRVVVPALWARGVASLDALLITHPDPDHIGGAGAVLDALALQEFWLGVRVPGHEPSEQLLSRVTAGRTRVVERRAGDRLWPGSVRIRVLHPPPPDWERRRVRNDDSVVLEIVHGDVAVLLLGDVGADVERAIVRHLTPARVRVLKAGHHGSRTSTSPALVETWRPDVALISCGRGNSFGHPAPAVLARLQESGAAVFRTDIDGQITVRSDGRQVWVETFRGRRAWVRPA